MFTGHNDCVHHGELANIHNTYLCFYHPLPLPLSSSILRLLHCRNKREEIGKKYLDIKELAGCGEVHM